MPSPWPGSIALANSPRSGCPTLGMKRYASWCGPVRPRWRTCAPSASICNPFCCATGGSTAAPGPGPRSMPGGSPTSASSTRPSIWSCANTGRPSTDGGPAHKTPASAILSVSPWTDLSRLQALDPGPCPVALQPQLRAPGPVSGPARIPAGHRPMADLRTKRQHLQSFLSRHGRISRGSRPWTQVHARWLSNLSFEHPAQYLVLREYRQAIDDAETRLERLTQRVAEVVSSWSMAPVVEAYQALRGVAFLTAVTFVAEIGDVRRFETPRQLMAYLGLVPSERSTGAQVWRGSITKAGNPRARRVLIEGAWTYRYPARLSRPLQVRQESLPTVVRAIAWKAQLRLCARYRRLMAAGKRQTVVTTAIAREMAAFLWAIGHAVEPRPAA